MNCLNYRTILSLILLETFCSSFSRDKLHGLHDIGFLRKLIFVSLVRRESSFLFFLEGYKDLAIEVLD